VLGIGVARILLIVAIAFGLGGCLSIRNALTDRDLVCQETPDDLCIRIAGLGLAGLELASLEAEIGPIPTIQVYPVRCNVESMGMTLQDARRCWVVEATNAQLAGPARTVVEQADGSLEALF
jgi:hypothetical protein